MINKSKSISIFVVFLPYILPCREREGGRGRKEQKQGRKMNLSESGRRGQDLL